MKILCLMGLFPKEYEQTILDNSCGGVQNAANKFQWGIVNGLCALPGVECKILNSLYIGSYPRRYKQLKIPTFPFDHGCEASDLNVGFTNLTGYKVISRYHTLKREILRWIEETNGEQQVVLAYAMTSPMVELLQYIKKNYEQIICLLVVPDLPEYMNVSSSNTAVYRFCKGVQIRHFRNALKPVDGYILLTKYMAEWFPWEIRYTVMEGLCSQKPSEYPAVDIAEKRKCVLYAGMIDEKYGVLELVKAFAQIDLPGWSLELFGNGPALAEIRKLTREDPRIHIRGLAPNAQVVEEQQHAEILVNPRSDTHAFTKYSFPSKVMEYFASGTPMVGYQLSGMPDEYLDYFYRIPAGEAGAMKAVLEYVMTLSSEERREMGRKAFDFVTGEKCAQKQCEKIVRLINCCEKT